MSNIPPARDGNNRASGMQPLPEQLSADDKEWNPNDDDAEFERENNFRGHVFDDESAVANRAFGNNDPLSLPPRNPLVT